jgi:hypothetical protein
MEIPSMLIPTHLGPAFAAARQADIRDGVARHRLAVRRRTRRHRIRPTFLRRAIAALGVLRLPPRVVPRGSPGE